MIKDRPKLEEYMRECWAHCLDGEAFKISEDIDYKTYVRDVISWAIEAENYINELKFRVSNLEHEKELLQQGFVRSNSNDVTEEYSYMISAFANDLARMVDMKRIEDYLLSGGYSLEDSSVNKFKLDVEKLWKFHKDIDNGKIQIVEVRG